MTAQQQIFMAEHYKTNKVLEKHPKFSIIMKDILMTTDAPLVILFGSYAKGRAKSESDIDIFIETKERKLKEKIKHINRKITPKIGVFDPNNLLVKEIIKNHVIIRGVEYYYEKINFFS